MKQISQNYKTGEIQIEEARAPVVRAGGVLVQTHYSVLSAGTESMKVREGKMSYLGKAIARPDQVKKVLGTLRQQGLAATYQKVMNKLDKLTPLGYSLAGEVVAVGAGAEEFQIGQRVACAGAGYANHAEINFIPRNLVVPVPDAVSLKHAAFATIGSIALQGFRQARAELGETAVVIGLGLIGQLLVQILRSAGVQSIGVDVVQRRCDLAIAGGARAAFVASDPALVDAVKRLTDGYGADMVFLVAGGSGNQPLELAVELARDRARIIDIGKTKLDLPWNDCYMKELDVRFSRSYGPGRYDPMYEEGGVDYPVGYVRWTERRNMAAFIDLVATGRVNPELLDTEVCPFAEAEAVYERVAQGGSDRLATIFEYGRTMSPSAVLAAPTTRASHGVRDGQVRLGVIGAGNYALTMLLPNLRANEGVQLQTVATASGLSGNDAVRKFGFRHATTNYRDVLDDPEIDAVLIATRHSSHAHLTTEALRAGKAVYVEKPLALTGAELESIREAINDSGNDRLMVGFNRRFAPIAADIAEHFARVPGPLVLHYRVHAGQLDAGSWYLDSNEGSRFVGEGGHFIDLISFVSRSRPVSIYARSLRPERPIADDLENLAVIVQLENGSVGNILYLTQGGAKTPKEYLEVHGGGRTARMENFESVIHYEKDRSTRRRWRLEKGQKEMLASYVECVRTGRPMPISLTELVDTTAATLATRESVRRGAPVLLAEFNQDRERQAQAREARYAESES